MVNYAWVVIKGMEEGITYIPQVILQFYNDLLANQRFEEGIEELQRERQTQSVNRGQGTCNPVPLFKNLLA